MARVQIPVTTCGLVAATYTTALAGSNNDLVFTAVDEGPGGNDITVAYVVSGTNTALAVSAKGKAITVTVATDGGGAAVSTAAQVKAALEGNSDIARLITVAYAAANDGSGVVTALSAANLTGGAQGVARPAQTNSDATNDMYFTGNDGSVIVEVENANASSQTVTVLLAPGVAPGYSTSGAGQPETIAAGAVRVLGPWRTAEVNQNAAGDVFLDPSVSTDLKFRALKVPAAR